MSAKDFIPTLEPTTVTQWGVNTIYAASLGAFIGSKIDIPTEYGAIALGGAYAVVTGPKIIENQIYSDIDKLGKGVLGVEGAGKSVKDFESNAEKWWARVVEGKSAEEVYGKGSSPKGNNPDCQLTAKNIQDPKFAARCWGK